MVVVSEKKSCWVWNDFRQKFFVPLIDIVTLFCDTFNVLKKLRQDIGRRGEDQAAEFLKRQGYRIVERNYRTPLGEIDIIAWDKDCLCFIEVKARQGTGKGRPEEAVSRAKIRKVSQNVLYYLKTNAIEDCSMRFDVVAVIADGASGPADINLIKDAFELATPYFYG